MFSHKYWNDRISQLQTKNIQWSCWRRQMLKKHEVQYYLPNSKLSATLSLRESNCSAWVYENNAHSITAFWGDS